jgi:hypothetical protein
LNDGQIQNPSNPFGIVPLSNFVQRGFVFVHHSKCHSLSRSAKPHSQIVHRCTALRDAAAARHTGCRGAPCRPLRPVRPPSALFRRGHGFCSSHTSRHSCLWRRDEPRLATTPALPLQLNFSCSTTAMGKVANRDFRDFGWEIAHGAVSLKTPADFPRHDGSPYRELRVRRWGLGCVHRSRAIRCRAVPIPTVTIRLSHFLHRCVCE